MTGGIQIVSDEEAEKADFVVCALLGPTEFADNQTGVCQDCGCAIMFRPYVPKAPAKICLACMLDRTSGGTA